MDLSSHLGFIRRLCPSHPTLPLPNNSNSGNHQRELAEITLLMETGRVLEHTCAPFTSKPRTEIWTKKCVAEGVHFPVGRARTGVKQSFADLHICGLIPGTVLTSSTQFKCPEMVQERLPDVVPEW